MAVLVKLQKKWKNKNIGIPTKMRLLKALVWPVVTYGCEAWILKESEIKKINAFEMKCIRKVLGIVYLDRKTNTEVLNKAGTGRDLMAKAKERKLKYFGHIARQDDSLEKSIMMGMVEGKRSRGRPQKTWIKNITEWTGMSIPDMYRATKDKNQWRKSVHVIAQRQCGGEA